MNDAAAAPYEEIFHERMTTIGMESMFASAIGVIRVLAEAHYIARSGRPGPVVVDVTKTSPRPRRPAKCIIPGRSA